MRSSLVVAVISALSSVHARQAVSAQLHAACRLRGGADEHTYAMMKPDICSNRKAEAHIKRLINEAGLTIVREDRCRLSRAECEHFYAEHSERPFFPGLVRTPLRLVLGKPSEHRATRSQVEFMSSGDVLKLELQGEDAVRRWRELIGPTNSEKARKEASSSVRALYGKDNQRNAAHGSDSLESAAREIALMFD